KEREAAAERVAKNDAIRRDRNLIARYPNEAAHNRARAKALDDLRASVRVSKERIALLNAERKPLLDEAEFYVGKSLPSKLKLALDANDASLDAQKALIQTRKPKACASMRSTTSSWRGCASYGPARLPDRSAPRRGRRRRLRPKEQPPAEGQFQPRRARSSALICAGSALPRLAFIA
ncbi:MAG TPA: hypothetical protein VFF72_01660, partial [Caldimonas sp.]|nr:hypothetical protein [Caldimonas sp.]